MILILNFRLILFIKGFILLTSMVTSKYSWETECNLYCQCQITNLPNTTLSRWLPRQEDMKVTHCTIQKETSLLQIFQNIPRDTEILIILQTLDAEYGTLLTSMFSDLQQLRGIELQGAATKTKLKLAPQIFQTLPWLQYLSIRHVSLGNFEKIFVNLQTLEVLQIINCNVGILKWEMLDGLKSLKELYFVHSKIKELGDFSFYGTPQLYRLYLSHNNLLSINSDAFIGLSKLEMLDLSNNYLDHLSSLTFPSLPKLQWLELKHNPIKVVFPNSFHTLNSTQRLTLGHSKQAMHLMKFSFRGLESLIFLHIPNVDNDILVEHVFYGLHSLLHLNLNGRIMMLGDKTFLGAHKTLKKLVLYNCKLRKISDNSFQGLHRLISLDLSYNQLRHLSEASLQPLDSLKELILSQNKLYTLAQNIFKVVPLLQAVRLDANPWNCTCAMLMWNENIMTKVSVTVRKACNSSNETSMCSAFETTYKEDKRIIPRCETPNKFQGRNIFEILKSLKCNETFPSS